MSLLENGGKNFKTVSTRPIGIVIKEGGEGEKMPGTATCVGKSMLAKFNQWYLCFYYP